MIARIDRHLRQTILAAMKQEQIPLYAASVKDRPAKWHSRQLRSGLPTASMPSFANLSAHWFVITTGDASSDSANPET
jgi:hypothetical protein